MARQIKKHTDAAKRIPPPLIERRAGARFGVVTIGGCDNAAREALDTLDRQGTPADYMRIRGFPFAAEVQQFLESHGVNFVIEQNRDAQLKSLLTLETGIAKDKLRSVRVYGGFPLSSLNVVQEIVKQIG